MTWAEQFWLYDNQEDFWKFVINSKSFNLLFVYSQEFTILFSDTYYYGGLNY